MPKPYTAWSYFYPPRTAAMAEWGDTVMAAWLQDITAWGQLKINGNRNMIAISPEHKIRFWTRHKDDGVPRPQKYDIPDAMREKILSLAPKGHWTIFDTELLYFKTKHVKDVLYFFDILVWKSEHLLGVDYPDRYAILQSLLGEKYIPLADTDDEEKQGAALGRNELYIAQNFPITQWKETWERIQRYEFVEGLVLKATGGISRLGTGHEIKNNSSWMCKLRKPHKNFRK